MWDARLTPRLNSTRKSQLLFGFSLNLSAGCDSCLRDIALLPLEVANRNEAEEN